MRKVLCGLVMAATMIVAPVASATVLLIGSTGQVTDLDGDRYGPIPPGVGSESVDFVRDDNWFITTQAGLFVLDFDDASTPAGDWVQFVAFCLDPDRTLQPFEASYTVYSLAGAGISAQVANDLGELWALARNLVIDSNSAAAFQLAIWELAYGTTDYDLSAGAFRASGGSVALAQSWVNTVAGQTGAVDGGLGLLVGVDNVHQRMLMQVPEPATLALLGLGLAGIGFGARRRKA